MEDFDWITARCQCSPAAVFEKLKSQVQSDVEKRDASLHQVQKERYRFEFITGSSAFSVLVGGDRVHGSIKFAMTESGIRVFDEDGNTILSADVTISDDGSCKLKVNKEEKELWQIRKMALETFLFRHY